MWFPISTLQLVYRYLPLGYFKISDERDALSLLHLTFYMLIKINKG